MLFATMARYEHSIRLSNRRKVVPHDNNALIILGLFQEILLSSTLLAYARKESGYFTQSRKIHLHELLLFLIFRHCNTLNEEISSFFSEINRVRCSRQAMFKAMAKINPEVFRVFIWQFSARFYTCKQIVVRIMDGYIVIAIDGTHIDLPFTDELVNEFGGTLNKFITKREDIRKPQARVSMLYDVLNHILLDAWIQPYDISEIKMLFEHLEKAQRILRNRKVIILADRYYGSVELYLYCKLHGYAYLVRGKKGHYADEVATVQEDGTIKLMLDAAWIKRMHRPELQDYAKKLRVLELRTLKSFYTYIDPNTNRRVIINGLYFASPELNHLSRDQIIALYHSKRWRIEIGYLRLKDHLEAENFNSRKSENIKCAIYAKLLCLNLLNPFYFEADRLIQENLCPKKSRFTQKRQDSISESESDTGACVTEPDPKDSTETHTANQASSFNGFYDNQEKSDSVSCDESVTEAEPNSDNENNSDKDNASTANTSPDIAGKTPYERKPNVKNILYSIRINPRLISFLLGHYDNDYPDIPFYDALNGLCKEFSLERISVRPNRHVKRWGRYIKSLPHLKFRVDGRRNPVIERCRNGASGYVTRQ